MKLWKKNPDAGKKNFTIEILAVFFITCDIGRPPIIQTPHKGKSNKMQQCIKILLPMTSVDDQ